MSNDGSAGRGSPRVMSPAAAVTDRSCDVPGAWHTTASPAPTTTTTSSAPSFTPLYTSLARHGKMVGKNYSDFQTSGCIDGACAGLALKLYVLILCMEY